MVWKAAVLTSPYSARNSKSSLRTRREDLLVDSTTIAKQRKPSNVRQKASDHGSSPMPYSAFVMTPRLPHIVAASTINPYACSGFSYVTSQTTPRHEDTK